MITRADSNTLITFSEAAAVSMGGSRPGTTTSSAILLSPTGSRGHSSAHGGAHSGKHFMNASTVSSLSGRMGFDGGFLSQREAGGMDGSRRAGSASGRTGSGRHHHRSHSHHHRQSSITSNSHNPINLAGMSVASVVGSLSMQNQWFDIEEALGIAITAAVRGAGVLVEAEEIGRVESAAIGFAKACASAKGSIIDRTPTPVTASATALSNASIHSRRSGMEPNPGPSPRRSKANSIPSTKSPTLSSGAVHHSGSSFSPPSTTQIGGGGMGEMADHHLHPHHRLNSPMRRSSGGTPGMGSASSGLSGTGGLMAPSSRSSSPPLAKSQRAGSGAETSLSAATAVARARETVVRYLQAYTDRVVQASLAAVPPAGGTGLPGSTAADSAGVHPRPGTPPPAFAATTTMSSMGSPLPIISNSPSAGGLAHLNVSHTAAALPSLGSPRGGGGGGHGSGRPARLSSPGVAGGHLSPGASSSSIPQLCGAFPRSSSPQTPTMVAVTNTATGVPTASTHLPSMTSFSSHGQLRSPPLATGGSGVGGGPDEDGTGGSADGGEPPQQQLCHSGGAGRLSIKDSLSPAGTPPLLSSLQLSGSSTSSASRVPLVMSGATTTASPPPKSKLLQGHPNHNNNNNNNGGGNSSSCGPHSSIGSTAPTAPPQVSGSSGMSWNAGHLSPKSNRASRTPSPMLRGSMNNDSSLLGARRCSGSVAPPNVLSTPRPPSPMSNSSVGGGVGGLLTMVPQTAPSHPARTAGATQLHISTATPPLGFSTTTTLGSTTALNAITSPAVPTLRMKVLRPDEAPPFPTPLHSGGEMDAAAETASSSSSSYSYSCSTSSSSTTSHSQGDPDGGVARPPGAGAGHRCRHHRRRRLSTSSSSNSKSSSSTFCNTSNPSNGSSRSFSGDGASCSSSSSSPSSSTSCSCSSAMVSSLSSDDSNSIPALYASASRPTLVQQGSGSRHAATHPAPHYSQRSTLHPTTLDLVEDLSDPHASSHHVHPPNYNPNKAGHRHPPPPLDSNTHHHHKAARGGERDDGWMRSGSEGPSYPSEELGARLQSETQGNEKKFAAVNTATAAQGSSSPLPPLPVASTTTPTTSPMMGPMSASASSTPFLPLRGFTSPVSPFSGTLGSRRFGAPLQLPTTSPQYAWIVDLNEVSAARGLPDTYISVTLVRDSDPELSVLFFPFAKEKFTWNPHATHPPAQPGGATHSHHSNTNNNAPNNSVPPPPPAPLVFGGGGLHGLSGVPQRSGSIASVNAMTFASASGFSGLQEGRNRGAGGMSSKAVSEASALLLSPSAIGMSAATGGGGGGASSIIGGGGGGGNLRAGRVGSAGATSMGGSSIFAFGNPTTMTDHHDVCIGSPPPTPRSGVQTPPPPPFSMPHSTFNSPGNSPQSTAGGNPHHHNHSNNNNNNSSSNSNTNTGVLLTQGTGTGAFNSNSPFFLPPSAATGTGTGFDRSPSLQFPPLSPSSPAPSVHGMRDGGLLPSTPSASYYHTGERGPSPPGGGPAGVAHFTPWWTGGELFISVEDRGAFLNGVRLNSGTASGGGSAYASLHHRPFTSASGRTSPNQLYSMLPTPPPTFLNASPQSHPPPVNHTNGGPTFQASVLHEHSQHSYHPIAPHSAIADRLRQTSLGTIMTELGSASASSTSSPNRPMIDPLPNPPPMRPHSRQSRPGLRSASSSTATLDFSTAVAAAASASPLSRAVVLLHSKPPPPVTAPRSASAPPFFSSGTSVSANTTHNRAGAGVGTRVSVVPSTAEAQSSVTAVPIAATLDEQRQHEAEQERLTDIAAELVVHHDVDSLQYGSHPVAAMAAIAAGRADVLLNTGVYYVGWHHLLGAALLVREAGGYVKGITGTTNATRDHTGGAAAGCRRGPDSQQRKSSAAASSNTPQKEEVFPVHGKTGSACTNTTTTTAAVTTASETVPAKDRTGGDASFAAATATAVETEEPRRKSRGRPRRQRSAPSQRGSTPPPPHPPEEPDLRRGKRPARRSNESSLVTGGAGSGSGGGDTMGAVPAQASLPPSRPDEDPQTPGPGELRQRKLAAAAGATGSGVYAMDPHNEPSGPLPCHERTGTLSPLSSEDDLDEERQKKRLQQKTKTFNASSVPEGLAVQSHPIDSSSTPSRDGSPLLLAEVMTVEESFSPPPPSKKPASRKSQKKKHHHTKKKHHHHHHHHHHHTCSHIVPDQQQQEQQQRVEDKDGDAQDPTRKAEGKQKQKHKHHHCRRRLRGGHPHNNGDQKREEDDDEKRASSTSPLMLMVGGETAPLQASNSFGEDLIQLHVPASRSPHRNSGSSSSKKPPPLLDPTSEHHGHPSASYAGAPPQRHQRHRRCGRHHGHRRRQGSPAHANTTTTANHPRQNGSSGGGGGGVQSSGKKPFLLHTSHGASCSSVLLSPSSTGGGRAGGRPSSSLQSHHHRGARRGGGGHRRRRVASQSFSDSFMMDEDHNPDYRPPNSPSEIVGIIAALDQQVVETMSRICMEKKLGVRVEMTDEDGKG